MKKVIKSLSVLFVVILAVSVFVFAADGEEEKTYIVYPKETVSLFSAEGESPEYMVIGEEELNMLLEEAPEMIDWYEEDVKGEVCGEAATEDEYVTYDEIYKDINGYAKYELGVVNAAAAWEKGYYGNGVKVAIIDTGIEFNPDFYDSNGKTRITKQYDLVNCDDTADDVAEHGTHVAGMIFAEHGNIGIKGIAPNVELYVYKVSDTKTGISSAYVASAIDMAVEDGCSVINISLAFPSINETLKTALDKAINAGVVVVAAVGNYTLVERKDPFDKSIFEKNDSISYPAAYPGVVGVGSVNRLYGYVDDIYGYNGISPFSKQNSSVVVVAPGGNVITTSLEKYGYWVYDNGTSLAAPLVTGAVALLKQANPELTPAEIMDILAQSATDDVKGDGYDTAYGHGILNVASAIELALGKEVLAPENVTYSVTAENTNLNSAITVENYTPGNIGSHPLGASFTATAMPIYTAGDGTTYKFAYWANGNGTHVSGEAKYTFNAVSNFTLRAVYDKAASDESVTTEKKVEFWNGNGILLDTVTADEGTGRVAEAAIPTNPTMTGFSFTSNWLHEDESIFNVNDELEKTLTRVVAQFEDTTTQYSITFEDNTAKDTKTGKYGDTVEYTAGEGFDYWKLGDKTISYDAKIEIALWDEEKILTAVYDEENITAKPTVVLDTGADNASFLIYSVPDGYTIIDAGIVFGTEGSTPRVASFHSKASVKKLPEGGFGQFTAQPGEASHAVARGYLIYNDGTAIRVIYTD